MAQGPAKKQKPKHVSERAPDKGVLERKSIAQNRRARYDYHIDETYEVGIVLVGPEVKSLRTGQSSINEAFARLEKQEIWLLGMHIAEYFEATYNNHVTRRKRKLLLNAREIKKIEKALAVKGTTLIPLELFFNERGLAKLVLAVARGKRAFDKRQDIKKRETDREIRRIVR